MTGRHDSLVPNVKHSARLGAAWAIAKAAPRRRSLCSCWASFHSSI